MLLYKSGFLAVGFRAFIFNLYLFARTRLWSTICLCIDVHTTPLYFTGPYLNIPKAKAVFGFILKTRGKKTLYAPQDSFTPITGLLLCKVLIKKFFFYRNTCILILSRKIIYTFGICL